MLRRMRTVGIAQTLAQRSAITTYDVIGFGLRTHLYSLFAAIGLAQLTHFDQARTARRQLWHAYATALTDLPDVVMTDVDIDHNRYAGGTDLIVRWLGVRRSVRSTISPPSA